MKAENAKRLIDDATTIIQERIAQTVWSKMDQTKHEDRARLVGRYTAAFAAEFQAWLGATHLFVRNEQARFALAKNIRCEFSNDHIGMLYTFAGAFDEYSPRSEDRKWIRAHLGDARQIFKHSGINCGLRMLAALTLFENASRIFIPVLDAAASESRLGSHDYPLVHGEADIEHSQDLIAALEAEWHEGYQEPRSHVSVGISIASSLVLRVFADP